MKDTKEDSDVVNGQSRPTGFEQISPDGSAPGHSREPEVCYPAGERGGRQDPIETLTRRARWAWHRVERQIVADHEIVMAGRLRQLAGLRRPVEVTSISETGYAAIVNLHVPGWQILMAGVALGPRRALSAAAESHRLRLSGAGRYGRFWWLSIEGNHGMRVVLLGSHLRLEEDRSGFETQDAPPPALQLVGSLPTW